LVFTYFFDSQKKEGKGGKEKGGLWRKIPRRGEKKVTPMVGKVEDRRKGTNE